MDKKRNKQSAAGPKVQQDSDTAGTARFAENRTAAVTQRRLREGMVSSPRNEATAQLREAMQSTTANQTGLPDGLKSGIENLSGLAMDDVKVHYNSGKPAQLQAHAYAQGSDIHLAPGQEKHLPHEAWHVVQQKQGRVQATRQLKGKVGINDERGLEKEADVMGARALHAGAGGENRQATVQRAARTGVVQRVDKEYWAELIERDIEDFFANLRRLLDASEREHDVKEFRLVSVAEVLHGAAPEVARGFFRFVNGLDPAKGTVIEEEVQRRLEREFGYDQVEDMKKALFASAGWKNLEFKTVGTGAIDFLRLNEHALDYQHMRRKIKNHPDPEGLVKEVVTSGSSNPEKKKVKAGQKFYKLMGPGKNITKSFSPYYLTWDEIMSILQKKNLADHLGLPLMNYEAVYFVYEITAQVDTTVFESTIAPTEQKIKTTGRVFKSPGGRRQTLIMDNMDPAVWAKNGTPTYILDPVESELMALMAPRVVNDPVITTN